MDMRWVKSGVFGLDKGVTSFLWGSFVLKVIIA